MTRATSFDRINHFNEGQVREIPPNQKKEPSDATLITIRLVIVGLLGMLLYWRA